MALRKKAPRDNLWQLQGMEKKLTLHKPAKSRSTGMCINPVVPPQFTPPASWDKCICWVLQNWCSIGNWTSEIVTRGCYCGLRCPQILSKLSHSKSLPENRKRTSPGKILGLGQRSLYSCSQWVCRSPQILKKCVIPRRWPQTLAFRIVPTAREASGCVCMLELAGEGRIAHFPYVNPIARNIEFWASTIKIKMVFMVQNPTWLSMPT